MRAVCGTARLLELSARAFEPPATRTATHSARPCQIGQVTVFAQFSGLQRVRITVAVMVAERRLRFLDVTGPG
jgi:hypothetical protein